MAQEAQISPIVVGGTGGSGTRLVAELLQHAGVFMGADENLNYAMDSLPMSRVDMHYLRGKPDFNAQFLQGLHEHRCKEHDLWGWKHTSSYLTLPMWHYYFRCLAFVHVVRDGRDLAYARHIALPTFGLAAEVQVAPSVIMALWARTNQDCAKYGENFVRHYYRVRYEDLCRQPVASIAQLYDFLGLEADVHAAKELVRPSVEMGRWRKYRGTESLEEVEVIGEYALKRFGYR